MTLTSSFLFCIHNGTRDVELQKTVDDIYSLDFEFEEIMVVVDGPVSIQLNDILTSLDKLDCVCIHRLSENCGFGYSLNIGLRRLKSDLVFRHDPDDEFFDDRFNAQLSFMHDHEEIDVCGGWAEVASPSKNRIVSQPQSHKEILDRMRLRNPLIHSTVVFRRQAIIEVGGYPPFRKCQDYALWGLLASRGYQFHNLQRPLVKSIISLEALKKRGFSYFWHEQYVLFFLLGLRVINGKNFLTQIVTRFLIRLLPGWVKLVIYENRK